MIKIVLLTMMLTSCLTSNDEAPIPTEQPTLIVKYAYMTMDTDFQYEKPKELHSLEECHRYVRINKDVGDYCVAVIK